MDMHIKLLPELTDFLKYLAEAHKVTPVDMAMHVLHEAIYIAACGVAGDMAIFEEEPELHAAARQVVTIGPSKLHKVVGE